MTSLVIVDDMDPSISYTGPSWMETPSFIQRLSPGASNPNTSTLFDGSLHGVLGSSLEASFFYKFTGSAVFISGGILTGSELPDINCLVDGLKYSPIKSTSHTQVVFCHAPNLESGAHTVNFATNITDPHSGVWFDYIRLNSPDATSAPAPVEDLDSLDFKLVRWDPATITEVAPIQKKTQLNFSFIGDSLTCLGCPLDPPSGIPAFDVTINGTISSCNVRLQPCQEHQVQITYTGDSDSKQSKHCKPAIVVGSNCDPGNPSSCTTGCGDVTSPYPAVSPGESSSFTVSPSTTFLGASPSALQPPALLSAASSRGHRIGAIVGGVIGGLVFVLLVFFILFIIWRRRSLKENAHVEGSGVIQPEGTLISIGNVASRRSARSSMHKSLPPAVSNQRSSIAKSFFSWRAYDDIGPQQTAQVGSDYGASPTTPRRESGFSFETKRETDREGNDPL